MEVESRKPALANLQGWFFLFYFSHVKHLLANTQLYSSSAPEPVSAIFFCLPSPKQPGGAALYTAFGSPTKASKISAKLSLTSKGVR